MAGVEQVGDEMCGHTYLTTLQQQDLLDPHRGADLRMAEGVWKFWQKRVLVRNETDEIVVVEVAPGRLHSYVTKTTGEVSLSLPTGGGVKGEAEWCLKEGPIQSDELRPEQSTGFELDEGGGYVTAYVKGNKDRCFCINRKVKRGQILMVRV